MRWILLRVNLCLHASHDVLVTSLWWRRRALVPSSQRHLAPVRMRRAIPPSLIGELAAMRDRFDALEFGLSTDYLGICRSVSEIRAQVALSVIASALDNVICHLCGLPLQRKTRPHFLVCSLASN